jgi:hypothetical protein
MCFRQYPIINSSVFYCRSRKVWERRQQFKLTIYGLVFIAAISVVVWGSGEVLEKLYQRDIAVQTEANHVVK